MRRFIPQILLLTALLMNAAANILMKYSAVHGRSPETATGLRGWVAERLHPAFLLGVVLFALNVLAYQAALRSLKLSLAYPIMVSGGYLIILLVSWSLFEERLGAAQYAGIGLILAGIWLVVR